MREDHIMTSETQNTVIKNMASDGCYFLAICELGERIAHRPVDAIETAVVAIKSKWMTESFKVEHPETILEFITDRKFKVSCPKTKPEGCMFYIEKWHNNRTGFDHFRLHDWDSLKNSVTVREGYIEDYRVFEEAD